jgi:hypothetical protein
VLRVIELAKSRPNDPFGALRSGVVENAGARSSP